MDFNSFSRSMDIHSDVELFKENISILGRIIDSIKSCKDSYEFNRVYMKSFDILTKPAKEIIGYELVFVFEDGFDLDSIDKSDFELFINKELKRHKVSYLVSDKSPSNALLLWDKQYQDFRVTEPPAVLNLLSDIYYASTYIMSDMSDFIIVDGSLDSVVPITLELDRVGYTNINDSAKSNKKYWIIQNSNYLLCNLPIISLEGISTLIKEMNEKDRKEDEK